MMHTARVRWGFVIALMALMSACASPKYKAPVEDRARTGTTAPTTTVPDAKPLPGIENAGKPGYVTVKPGDTLIRIATDAGQSWRDVARWNNIENPDSLLAGQVLRVVPPASETTVAARPIVPPRVETRPLEPKPAATANPADSSASTPTGSAATGAAPTGATPGAAAAPASTAAGEELTWAWPVSLPVTTPFDGTRNKGMIFAGKLGDPVLAAATGRVLYAGSSLRGYGNLVIIKHTNNYLSIYAHNKTLLVKEEQVVRRGQKIAEMGSTDADRVQLHFEVRNNSVVIDPMKVLPPR